MRSSEWLAVAYFLYLAGVTFRPQVSAGRRARVLVAVAGVVALILTLAGAGTSAVARMTRDWIPLLYIVVAYWLPAQLVVAPDERFERVLARIDRHWLGDRRSSGSHLFVELAELCYLFCYPLVPIGFACLYFAGFNAELDRFWTAVFLAVFPCYGLLPWLPTRPPRVIEPEAHTRFGISAVRTLNLRVLKHASVQLNTFPSGHVASALATALVVAVDLPVVGLVLAAIAVGIAIGSIVGRYHYVADVLAGGAIGLAAFWGSR